MTNMRTMVTRIALVAVILGAGGVSLTLPTVFAQDRPQPGALGPFGNEEFVVRLAQQLGIPRERLVEAVQQTVHEMEARVGMRPAAMPPEPVLRLTVQILGIDPESLGQELGAGKSLAQVAEERGWDAESYADALTQGMEQQRILQMRRQVRELIERPVQ